MPSVSRNRPFYSVDEQRLSESRRQMKDPNSKPQDRSSERLQGMSLSLASSNWQRWALSQLAGVERTVPSRTTR